MKSETKNYVTTRCSLANTHHVLHTHTHTHTYVLHVTTHCSLANTHHLLVLHTHTYKSDTGTIILQSHSHRAEHTKPLLEKSQILKQLHGLPIEQRTVCLPLLSNHHWHCPLHGLSCYNVSTWLNLSRSMKNEQHSQSYLCVRLTVCVHT